MKPEMTFAQNEILLRHEKNYVYISFHCWQNEMNFFFLSFNLLSLFL